MLRPCLIPCPSDFTPVPRDKLLLCSMLALSPEKRDCSGIQLLHLLKGQCELSTTAFFNTRGKIQFIEVGYSLFLTRSSSWIHMAYPAG